MSLSTQLSAIVGNIDQSCSGMQLRVGERRGGLIGLCLHALFQNAGEIAQERMLPQQVVTVEVLRQAIEYFQGAGYRFVSPIEIVEGLDPQGRYVVLSFDDGYYNNRLALPLMERYGVPAVFFVVAEWMQESRGAWWDVLYRLLLSQGLTRGAAADEVDGRIAAQVEAIEAGVEQERGFAGFKAEGDLDRVFTAAELREFSAHPLVHIGNHTWKHEYLAAYPGAEVRRRIALSQEILQEVTGRLPLAIAYPCGAWSEQVAAVASDVGLRLGVTTQARKNYLRDLAQPGQLMKLGRFLLRGDRPIKGQCDYMRSDLMLLQRYSYAKTHLRRGLCGAP